MLINPKQYLSEWIVRHVHNKDLLFKRIADIKEGEDLILVTMKDNRKCAYLVEPFVNTMESISPLKEYDCCFLVCYNTKENFNFLIKNWDALVTFKRNFCVIFINPFSHGEKKWALYPATHDMVSEKESLKPGLQILYSAVDETTPQEIEKVIKE